jgi:hypothetical protein
LGGGFVVEGLVVCSLGNCAVWVMGLVVPEVVSEVVLVAALPPLRVLVVVLLVVVTLLDALGWTTGWKNRAGTSVGQGELRRSRDYFSFLFRPVSFSPIFGSSRNLFSRSISLPTSLYFLLSSWR